ncbi:ATP-binding cassette domain-containing protein [Streptomyces sp. M19]
MRQRVAIAMALVCEPELLIADEPTTALDVTTQAQILELIDDLRSRLGMAMILVTHDLGVIARRVDRVAVMYAGKVAERAPYGTCSRPRATATPRHCSPRCPNAPPTGTAPGHHHRPAAVPHLPPDRLPLRTALRCRHRPCRRAEPELEPGTTSRTPSPASTRCRGRRTPSPGRRGRGPGDGGGRGGGGGGSGGAGDRGGDGGRSGPYGDGAAARTEGGTAGVAPDRVAGGGRTAPWTVPGPRPRSR